MKGLLREFLADERGLETAEYAIIAGLVVVGVVASTASIGTFVRGQFGAMESALSAAGGGGAVAAAAPVGR